MKNLLKPVLACMAAALVLASCDKKEIDYADLIQYMTVEVDDDLDLFYFKGDDGTTFFPGDVSRFNYKTEYETEDGEIVSKSGNRVCVLYRLLKTEAPGYDNNIALYEVDDILSKDVTVAGSEEDVDTAGDEPVIIHDYMISGGWLDILYSFQVNSSTHGLTLFDNPFAEIPAEKPIPEGYQYLEFRQKADTGFVGSDLKADYVSFRLGAEYDPAVTGSKGFYIRIKNLNGAVEYVKLDNMAPSASRAAFREAADDVDLLR